MALQNKTPQNTPSSSSKEEGVLNSQPRFKKSSLSKPKTQFFYNPVNKKTCLVSFSKPNELPGGLQLSSRPSNVLLRLSWSTLPECSRLLALQWQAGSGGGEVDGSRLFLEFFFFFFFFFFNIYIYIYIYIYLFLRGVWCFMFLLKYFFEQQISLEFQPEVQT